MWPFQVASKGRRAPPPTVPTDTIVPFHYYDNSKHTNGLCFDLTFQVDDVLDDDKLRNALSRLLELGDWRKLGARIRRNSKGALDYHIPRRFDKARPGFAFSTAVFDLAVEEHPQASRMAQPHELDAAGRALALKVPSCEDSSGRKAFLRNPGFPQRLDDWMSSDSPQLGIHIIHFQDATLVTVSFLHSLTDMMGLRAIMDAWTAVFSREEDRVKPFLAFAHDPLGSLSKMEAKPPERYKFADMLLGGWSWLPFAVSYYLTIELFWPLREEERIVFLPARHLARMRDEAMQELAGQASSDGSQGDRSPFVSEGDVIFAWWTRILLRAERPSPVRTISMRNTCCCRSLLQELGLIPSAAGSALVTNAVFGAVIFLTVRQVLDQSLALTASNIRKSLTEQRNAQQLRALDAIRRDCLDNKRHPAIFGDPTMYMFMVSNWEKAKLFRTDFKAAVVGTGLDPQKRHNQLGRPSCVQGSGTRHYATRNTGVVIGKDAGGNYWLSYNLRKEAWLKVEQELLSMPC
ncbi:unnamed protein product [Discula destructiva]